MVYDLIVRGGTVVDGSGVGQIRASRVDGRIRKLGKIRERAAREVDEEGYVVAAGFIDIDTHFDAQVC